MAKVIRKHWQSEASAGLPRKDRQSCEYEAYVPDPLMGRAIVLEGAVAADVADAEAAITRLNFEARSLVATEAPARLLLRADVTASEVPGNIEAMVYAVTSVRSDGDFVPERRREDSRPSMAYTASRRSRPPAAGPCAVAGATDIHDDSPTRCSV
ncbi:MAG TPA: hypothetical protein VIL79_13195 [Thermoleophilia bacterium]